VAQENGPGADEIEELVVVGIIEVRTFAALE